MYCYLRPPPIEQVIKHFLTIPNQQRIELPLFKIPQKLIQILSSNRRLSSVLLLRSTVILDPKKRLIYQSTLYGQNFSRNKGQLKLPQLRIRLFRHDRDVLQHFREDLWMVIDTKPSTYRYYCKRSLFWFLNSVRMVSWESNYGHVIVGRESREFRLLS